MHRIVALALLSTLCGLQPARAQLAPSVRHPVGSLADAPPNHR